MALTFTLIDSASGKYSLDGSTIRVAAPLTIGTDNIIVRAQDGNGWQKTKTIPITVNSGTFTPTSETGLYYWFKADDASTRTIDTGVSQLADKSGNARHVVQLTAANQPTVALASVNGKDTILLNDADALNGLDHPVTLLHVFAVAKNISATQSRHIVRKGYTGSETSYVLRFATATTAQFYVRNSAGTQSSVLSVTVPTNTCLLEAWWDGTTMSLSCDGGTPVTQAFAGTALKDTIEGFGIGCNSFTNGGTEPLMSNFCEVFAYGDKKSDAIATSARSYLKAQWGTA